MWILNHYSDHWITSPRSIDRIAKMFMHLQDQNNRKYANDEIIGSRFYNKLKRDYDKAIEFYEINMICIKHINLNIV